MPRPNQRTMNYRRDVPGSVNVPEAVMQQLDALSIEHTDTRKVLDALRKTRGKRQVSPLRVPAHLRDGIEMTVERAQKGKPDPYKPTNVIVD